MIDVESIFRLRRPDGKRLAAYGFRAGPDGYRLSRPILGGQFTAEVQITADGAADYCVFDAQNGEEYVLARVPDAAGSFVGAVREAVEALLQDVALACFVPERYRSAQTRRILAAIEARYRVQPAFLWDDSPEFGALRLPGTTTWFGLTGRVAREKFGLAGGFVEVINLKNAPDAVAAAIRQGVAYPAYHMNKTHWYSVLLDDSLPDDGVLALVDASYALVKSKK